MTKLLYSHNTGYLHAQSAESIIDELITKAQDAKASDIHIEPGKPEARIRMRIDGLLQSTITLNKDLYQKVITRLKVMANLDIAQSRLPQDGRITINTTAIRISTCPTILGEKIVLRLLATNEKLLSPNQLGLLPEQLKLYQQAYQKPQGLILVTGPTGSGKTMTLYSALNELNDSQKNILTVEDPVEIPLSGINQISIHPEIGLDFASTLRSFLRQDPDIIMLGEIRDEESAKIAFRAAQTGHLVLSTLHTNSATETITRLLSLGISPHHIASTVSVIIAQRLIRKKCKNCNTPTLPSIKKSHDAYNNHQNNNDLLENICDSCTNGYKGRAGIFEILDIRDEDYELINNCQSHHDLANQAEKRGMITLKQSAQILIDKNITTQEEVLRVIG